LVGGTGGLCGAIILGERYGKDKARKEREENNSEIRHSVVLEENYHF
jgi:hypothetical protein